MFSRNGQTIYDNHIILSSLFFLKTIFIFCVGIIALPCDFESRIYPYVDYRILSMGV